MKITSNLSEFPTNKVFAKLNLVVNPLCSTKFYFTFNRNCQDTFFSSFSIKLGIFYNFKHKENILNLTFPIAKFQLLNQLPKSIFFKIMHQPNISEIQIHH